MISASFDQKVKDGIKIKHSMQEGEGTELEMRRKKSLSSEKLVHKVKVV